MHYHSKLATALGCVATLAMMGCATNAGVTPVAGAAQEQTRSIAFSASGWVEKGGISFHIPHYMVTRQMAARTIQPDVLFSYGGGHVLVAPKVYLIIWGYAKSGDPDNVASLLQTYVSNMGGSGHNNIYTQYYEKSGGSTTYITNPSNQFGGVWDDNTDVPTVPSDSQVAKESLKGVAHFGYDANGSYVVAVAHHHDPSGFGMVWCAYHSATTSGGKLVSYTNLPYQPDAGSSCGANTISPPSDERGVDEGVTIVEGHEEGESVTDPNPPSGWYNGSHGEIGDICAWKNIKNDPFGSDSFTMQPMFSNATQSCVHSY